MTKKILKFLFPFLCLLLSLFFPTPCVLGVKKGLEIAFKNALPALFPSLVLAGMLSQTLPSSNRKSVLLTPFFLGLLCGFPVGAKCISSLVKEKKLSQEKAARLLPFVSGASPVFLISFCGITLFSDSKKGLFLYIFQSIFLLIFFLFFFWKDLTTKEKETFSSPGSPSLFLLIPKAISSGMTSFLYIAACIIFFSFLSELFLSLFSFSAVFAAIFTLFLELTSGVKSLIFTPKKFLFPLCALGCGWNGMSVHLQTLGIISEERISPAFYFLWKGIFALLFFLSALFLQKVL